MRWRRRFRGAEAADRLPVPRFDRAVVALAVHAQQLDDRLARLERRLDESEEAALATPTHADVLDVRLHSARVAAEVARLGVELRAEIDRALANHTGVEGVDRRVLTLAASIADLSDRLAS